MHFPPPSHIVAVAAIPLAVEIANSYFKITFLSFHLSAIQTKASDANFCFYVCEGWGFANFPKALA